MKKTLLLIILFVSLIVVPISGETIQREPGANSDDVMVEDGDANHPPYDSITDGNTLRVGNLVAQWWGAGIRFINIPIPPNAVIDGAYLRIRANQNRAAGTVNATIKGQDDNDPATFSDIANFNARNRTAASVDWLPLPPCVAGTWYNSPDISSIIQELVNRPGWTYNNSMVVIIDEDGTSDDYRDFSSYNQGFPPLLIISYHLTTDYAYQFSDTYYENGTLYVPPVNVTVSGPGFTETFNTSGGAEYYSSIEPTLFYWDLGTATRRIYSVGSENFTVTMPESVYDTYVFAVKDFTGKTSLGSTYLELYRVINSTETLIERQIIDVHNEVPLNMVVGVTYTIKVRFSDGSIYNWGTFVPGDSTTFTIVLRGVEFSDQSYQASNFIFVEVLRPTATSFTVDYLATKNQTIWSNVTIQIRGGAIVAQISRTNNSYVYTYAGALANTSYVVLVNGDHTLLLDWGYTKIFDATETYPDIPDIETIFPMGNFDATYLVGWVLTIISGLTFSLIYRRAALLSMATMASFLTIFGFSDWSWNLIALVWFFAIVVYLTTGDKN